MLPQNTALLLIDVQNGFDNTEFWGQRNNLNAEENLARVLGVWRAQQRPVLHTQHLSRHPQSPLQNGTHGGEIKDIVKPLPGEPVIFKEVNSAFIGTDLEQQLRAAQIDTLVVGGITTDHCVSTTVRMASNMGFTVYLLSDGTVTFGREGRNGTYYTAEQIQEINLLSLDQEFATVLDTESLLQMVGQ